jgi:hypothetical protein
MLLDASSKAMLGSRLTVMPDERAAPEATPREAYLRHQRAVANATSLGHRKWTPTSIAALVAGIATLGLYVATVVSYYNDPQEKGPTNLDLPTATSIALVATGWILILPFLIESPSIAARVRNLVIVTVVAIGLVLVGIPVFVELGSLIGDLLYNLTH